MFKQTWLIASLFGATASTAFAVGDAKPATSSHDGSHDFDFLFGEWSGAQHKLKQRLANSHDWEDFGSHLVVRPLLGGKANLDQIVFQNASGYSGGATLRLFDPTRQVWSIYWVGTNSYTLDVPMVGKFVDGRGEFFGDDTFEGKPIKVRFIWTNVDLTHCKWEQAFSADNGKTWETNWTMDYQRTAF